MHAQNQNLHCGLNQLPSGSSAKAVDNRTRLPQNQLREGVKYWWKND
jgi:hypothetical protein